MKDPEFKKEWDDLELEYQVQAELIRARLECNMTQAELAEKSRHQAVKYQSYRKWKCYSQA